ncbi:WecB/TagA/CpsF family glycosyltransferase [Pseudoruegeria sp. HB172150]|uniref:WecB/TagA/CpsF family glycosyltransferase n=1 Tax=Pseudoruegeria sp. HB172150 TaxID=2721164 RepID=UPI0015560B51|nr:WecB/TagA/CpsF family glycosyltransferase [Pseudoruegeria sp. HB172150]
MSIFISNQKICINIKNEHDLLTNIRNRLEAGDGFTLATLNTHHIAVLRGDPSYCSVIAAQDLICADGNPVVWLSRLGRSPVSLVTGSDMLLPMAKIASELGISIALVGSTDAALKSAACSLVQNCPGLQVALCLAPTFDFDPMGAEADAVLRAIAESGAGLCFLALGVPKQEILATRGRMIIPDVGFASIGAGIDYIAWPHRRAPVWMRALALEWFWRLISEPGRLSRRYLLCALILPSVIAQVLRQRRWTSQ